MASPGSADSFHDEPDIPAEPRQGTAAVVSLLVIAAAVFSYLWAYPMTDALAKVSMIRPIDPDRDPRLRWALTGFVAIMTGFAVIAAVLRHLSRRQLRSIDRMNDADGAE